MLNGLINAYWDQYSAIVAAARVPRVRDALWDHLDRQPQDSKRRLLAMGLVIAAVQSGGVEEAAAAMEKVGDLSPKERARIISHLTAYTVSEPARQQVLFNLMSRDGPQK